MYHYIQIINMATLNSYMYQDISTQSFFFESNFKMIKLNQAKRELLSHCKFFSPMSILIVIVYSHASFMYFSSFFKSGNYPAAVNAFTTALRFNPKMPSYPFVNCHLFGCKNTFVPLLL